jgi:hypothetical protein
MRTSRNLLAPLVVGLVVLMLAACSSVSVRTNYDPSAQFGTYRTFALAPPQGVSMAPEVKAALKRSLGVSMAERGFTRVSSADADLYVVPHVFTQDRVSVQRYTNVGYSFGGWPSAYGGYGFWTGYPRTYTDVTAYTQGTLVLDFVDARRKKLVYRGVAKAVVGDPRTNAENVREAVEDIVYDMPGS